jgi:1-acyl-sn-glycerol-3-phosphate acyltransferase
VSGARTPSPGPEANPGAAALVHPPTKAELAWYTFCWSLTLLSCSLVWRLRIVGRENVPKSGPFIIAPVHRSYVDTVLAGYVTRRRPRYMAKEEIFSKVWAAKLFRSLGGFPVKRGAADRDALKMCELALANGEPVVLFPEGTRRSGPVVEDLFAGAAFVALRANVPIVPVGIGGSERALPPGAKMVRPARVAMVIGKALVPAARTEPGRAPRQAVDELTDRLQEALQSAYDEARVLARA